MTKIACIVPDLSRCRRSSEATRKTTYDIANFCRNIGFPVIIIRKCHLLSYIKDFPASLIKSLNYDILIVPYPALANPLSNSGLYESISLSILGSFKKVILYVYDLPIDQHILIELESSISKRHIFAESILFNRSYRHLCFNQVMKNIIERRYGIHDTRIYIFELLDYGCEYHQQMNLAKYDNMDKMIIVYAGGSYQHPKQRSAVLEFIQQIHPAEWILYIFLGLHGSFINKINRPNIIYKGALHNEEYINFLLKAHFGLVLRVSPYNEFGATSKFSSYMVAGLPALIPKSFKYLHQIINKYNVGIAYERICDIPDILKSYTNKEIREMAMNAYKLGLKLRKAFFFKKAIYSILKQI